MKRKSAYERGYDSKWQKARKAYLAKHPLCVMCLGQGRTTAATVVDHIVPHKGDNKLFWDFKNNVQSLCKPCHDRHKQRIEKTGRIEGATKDGIPIDPNHHWN